MDQQDPPEPSGASLSTNGSRVDWSAIIARLMAGLPHNHGAGPGQALLESLPQDIFDEISQWLTLDDTKSLCLTSRTLHKAFAHRKWAMINFSYPEPEAFWQTRYIQTPEQLWLEPIQQSNDEFKSSNTPRTHVPVSNYIRELRIGMHCDEFWREMPQRHCKLVLGRSSQRSTVTTTLDTISALPNLQHLQLNATLANNKPQWEPLVKLLPDLELLSILKPHKPWESVRFLSVQNLGSASFIQEMLRSHLPNLVGLEIAEKNLVWMTQVDAPRPPQQAEGIEPQLGSPSNLKRLVWKPDEHDGAARLEGFLFGMISLKRVSEVFKNLERLYIRGVTDFPLFFSGRPRGAFSANDKAEVAKDQDACFKYLNQMPNLKRVALPVYIGHNADPASCPERGSTRRASTMTSLANMILEKVPSLDQVCLVAGDRWMELDRKNAPDGIRWMEHPLCSTLPQISSTTDWGQLIPYTEPPYVGDSISKYYRLPYLDGYPEAWPLGLRDGSPYKEMSPTRASKWSDFVTLEELQTF
ncbi:hypothetical protein V8F20_002742 [Naviculisporaceae sp. PSN 640]